MKFKRMFALLLLAMGLIVANAVEAVVGDKGPIGNKGPVGDKGPIGNKGPVGDKGPVGNKGPVGDKGPIGNKGPAGNVGATGLTGLKGPSGGAKGDKGIQGDKGLQGNKGDAGTQIANGTHTGDTLVWNGSAWTPVAAVHGPTYIVGDRDLNSPSGTVGNIVYYIDGSGEHGLEVKTTDENFLMNYADAKIAAESYNLGGNIGSCVSNCWHLPSKTELNLLFEAQSISSIGSLSCNFYLSSTKSSSRSGTNQVWYQGFSYGEYLYGSQLSTLMCVRAVRVF